ncbi:hypothetical protein Esti_004463 [Eimeria stiedai]
MKSYGPSGSPTGWPCAAPRESAGAEGLRQRSAARATAVAEAVAAVAASDEHECGANSQLEALNLMLPRSMSLVLGSGKLEGYSSAEKLNTQGGPSDSSHVLHGYQALRAIRTRAYKFRTGYHNWRRHQAHGARGDIHDVFIEEPSPSANAVSPRPPIQGRGTETAGILMSALKSSGSAHNDSGPTRSGRPLPPTPVMADTERYGIEVAHDSRVERPHWLRFFFNPHTPLQSEGVWPLRRDFLSKIAARASVPQYSLNSSEIQCWIAHVGVGGFHRSHQCVFYDDLLAKTSAGFPDDLPEGVHRGPWAVCGIGILPADKKMSDILHEQEFLYTVLTRSQRLCEARVIGSLMDFVFAPKEPKRLRGLLVDERTKMLSLTITEKGYCMYTDGNLDKSLEPVKQDLKNCSIPKTALGLIYLGLKLRRAAGLLKKMVIQFATEIDVEMATWISKHVSFPCTMVDRITPLTGNEHITLLREDYGVDDKWPVVAEDFKQWVIGDSFCNDRPFFEAVGCLVVREVQSYEEMKLKLLNAGHSCVAYLATMLGYRFVDEAVRDIRVSGFLRSYMDEVTPCLQDLKVDVERYKEKIVERFGNAFVKDELQRVAQDGSSKFYSTTRSAVLELIERRKNVVNLSVALAAWMLYFATDQIDGCRIEPCDPKACVLRDFARVAVQRPFDLKPVGSFLNAVYGLPGEAAMILTRWVTMSLAALQMRGIAETLDAGGPLEALLDACFKHGEGWQSFVSFTQGLAS